MIATLLDWLGLGEASAQPHGPHGHTHGPGDHGHTHGVIDATIATTARGIWAIKWSFAVMAITAVLQLAVVLFSGSLYVMALTGVTRLGMVTPLGGVGFLVGWVLFGRAVLALR